MKIPQRSEPVWNDPNNRREKARDHNQMFGRKAFSKPVRSNRGNEFYLRRALGKRG
jgi:hypothetical protein